MWSPGEGNGKPLQYSCLENPMNSMKRQYFLYASQEATVKTGHGTQTGSKQEKEYVKAVYCHPAYLTYMQSTS